MLAGPFTRTRKSQKKYHQYIQKSDTKCDFCKFEMSDGQVIKAYTYFWLATNKFGYDVWDSLGVDEHLMLTPKRHVESIAKLDKLESLEYMKITADFESQGYSLYSRATQNIAKSVAHQHTHLIKLDSKRKKFLFFIRKPHLVLYF